MMHAQKQAQFMTRGGGRGRHFAAINASRCAHLAQQIDLVAHMVVQLGVAWETATQHGKGRPSFAMLLFEHSKQHAPASFVKCFARFVQDGPNGKSTCLTPSNAPLHSTLTTGSRFLLPRVAMHRSDAWGAVGLQGVMVPARTPMGTPYGMDDGETCICDF